MTDQRSQDGADLAAALKKKPRPREAVIVGLLFTAGFVSIAVTLGILFELGRESLLFFQDPAVSLGGFLGSTRWAPSAGDFGIWPLVLGTSLIAFIALLACCDTRTKSPVESCSSSSSTWSSPPPLITM